MKQNIISFILQKKTKSFYSMSITVYTIGNESVTSGVYTFLAFTIAYALS